MREQVERLTKLATDLLDLSRLDAGRIRVESRGRRSRQRRAGARGRVQAVAERRGHRLEVEVEGEPAALGDELRVLQVGRALVDNALVHTPAGSRRDPRVRGRGGTAGGHGRRPRHPAGARRARLRAVLPRRCRLASGSGLGLAIASELAAVMDGRSTLESHPGRTVATVSAPRRLGARSRSRFHVKTRPLPQAAAATVSRCAPEQSLSSPSSPRVLGATGVLLLGNADGWIDEEAAPARTVVVSTPIATDGGARPPLRHSSATASTRPRSTCARRRASSRSRPSSATASARQGSGFVVSDQGTC